MMGVIVRRFFGLVITAVLISVLATTTSATALTARPMATTLNWAQCPPPDPASGLPDAGQQCATLSVPLDYRSPGGQTIQIGVSRVVAANPSLRRGVLFVNPGGPGGAGLDLPRVMTLLFSQDVLDRYDIIGFDPRGVGTSTPLTCGLTEAQSEQAYVPLEQPGGALATASFMRDVAAACSAHNGGLLPFMTTANTARDMDVIRQALGEQKISYFAYSYGTYLGAVYSSLFPQKTDRFVLDSNVDVNAVWRGQFREWGPGGEIRFPDFAKFVAANDATYHLGATQSEVRRTYFQLIDQLHANPITLDDGTILNDTMFRELTFSVLENDGSFPSGAELWQLAKQSAPTAKLQADVATLDATATPPDNLAASGLAVVCDDVNWSRSTAQYRAEYLADSYNYPLFGPLGSNIWPCAYWQNSAIEPLVQITSNGPSNILMLQNLRDPATPYAGALNTHAALGQRSRLVSVDEGGHAIVGFIPNTCANNAATNYLAFGVFPSHDISCAKEPTTQSMSNAPLKAAAGASAVRLTAVAGR